MTNPLTMLQVSTRNHRMTILREDGLYRHIRFQEPGTSMWHFDLVTWPGHLVITGDLEDFHFARVEDMFEFFRGPVGRINPGYWAEKLRGPQRYQSYSFEQLKRRVYEKFRNWCSLRPGPHAPLWQDLRYKLLDDDYVRYDESSARTALAQFRHTQASGARFEFSDVWDWDLNEFDYHFLLSLHAIVWGINWYDTVKAGGFDVPPETTGVRTRNPAPAPRTPELVTAAPTCITVTPRGDLL